MSTIKQVLNNAHTNINLSQKSETPVIKAYKDDVVKAEPVGVSFEKSSSVSSEPDNSGPDSTHDANSTSETEVSKEEARKARREEWSQASQVKNRAIQAEKEAKEKLAKAQAFEQLVASTNADPLQLAKALGKDPTEFLRQYQNAMFNITEEEKPKPEEDVKTRLERYEAERQAERQYMQQQQVEQTRSNYIASKILPAIKLDPENPDRFQAINVNINNSANRIYDIMNAFWQEHHIELNPQEVAEEIENGLMAEFEQKIAPFKKIGKFAKHFAKEQEELQKQEEAQAPSQQLGAKKTISSSSTSSAPPPAAGTKQHVPFSDRSARLNKVLNKFGK